VMADLRALCDTALEMRGGRAFKMLLTVSPVPLTATAEPRHILQSSVYSKSVLRAVASDFSADATFADYFPSFEIINNPTTRARFFEDYLRSVKTSAVQNVMNIFEQSYFGTPPVLQSAATSGPDAMPEAGDVDCEDALLEAF